MPKSKQTARQSRFYRGLYVGPKHFLFSNDTMRLVPEDIRHDLFLRANSDDDAEMRVAMLDIATLNHAVAEIIHRDPNVVIGDRELDLFESLTGKRKDYSIDEDRHHRQSMWNFYFHGTTVEKCPKKVTKITEAPSARKRPAASPKAGRSATKRTVTPTG